MTVALVFPPTCDPTAPYVSVPLLAGWLRAHGIDVLPVDANIGACDYLLRAEALEDLRCRAAERFRTLNRRRRLSHAEQGAYLSLARSLAESSDAPAAISGALRRLRGEDRGFYDAEAYAESADVVQRSLALIGAAYAPLELSFSSYRSPFSLLTAEERGADAAPERNPYHGYFTEALIPSLLERDVSLVGISVAFPGQIQPAYSLAYQLKRTPEARGVHLTVGGPAMTQILARVRARARERALEPFDTAVIYEGEEALLSLVHSVGAGEHPRGIVRASRVTDLSALPAPDFVGLPLGRYLSPELVLPYDLSRGCPWGRCAFCHYGLAETGVAPYRERPLERAVEHLGALRDRHGARLIYLSEDSVRPESLLALAQELRSSAIGIRWSTDVRPEALLARPAAMQTLREGGALSFSFGVESGSERVLELMRKGISLATIRRVVRATAAAGIAAELMAFTDFPTETKAEALATVALLAELRGSVSLFMCGTFGLTHGSAVAREPARFAVAEVWGVQGDELGLELRLTPRQPWKSERDREEIDSALAELSAFWRLGGYPWAGSLSTAHTMLWYDRYGPAAFRIPASGPPPRRRLAAPRRRRARLDLERLASRFEANEAAIWETMVDRERAVSRSRYEELARRVKPAGRRS